MAKVSIITVTYNCRSLLEKTIKSIGLQTFTDFEHVVIDGKSTDGTVDVIVENLSRIAYWVSEPDRGIYDAMNKGLEAATGDYVIFLNAGDTFYENTSLEKIPFDQYPDAGIFYGETMILDKDGNPVGLRRKKLPHNLNWKHFKRGMVVCHQSVLVKRTIAPQYNLVYKYAADIDWVLNALKSSESAVFTGSIISNFIEGGVSSQKQKESLAERFRIMRHHFGLRATLASHFIFVLENVLIWSGLSHKYRKP
jgi:glycosyltransferase involved in cell wall biosynthesis